MSMTPRVQRGSTLTWRNAATQGVDVGGARFVYRQLGPDLGVPVIFLNHLAAELDRWDPRVVDGIAARRRVIVFSPGRPCGSTVAASSLRVTPSGNAAWISSPPT